MAFDIGDRVISKFTGPGTVSGEPFKTYDGEVAQEVTFDLATLGKRDWLVKKLAPAEDGGDIGA
jgi:hypothetical protein